MYVHHATKMLGGVFEPVEPPVEKPETPTTPPPTKDLLTIKINDKIMAVVGTQRWQCIAYGNGKYIAMGWQSASNTYFITRSTDGVTWTTPENMDRVDRLIFANARFVGWSGGIMNVSTDGGYTWTRFSAPSVPSGYGSFSLSDIAYGNGRFIAVSKSSGYTATSVDGVNWLPQ